MSLSLSSIKNDKKAYFETTCIFSYEPISELIGKRKSTGNRRTITVRFHDIPNVVDFLVLKHIYEDSLRQGWSEGKDSLLYSP